MNEAATRPAPPPGPPAPLLPPDSGRDRPLFAVAAILVFLACLAALGARGAWRVSDAWTADLRGAMTVQVRPQEGRDPDADAAEAARIAQTLPEVASAEARSREEAEALLRPWLGAAGLPDDLPAPRIVDVRLRSGAGPPAAALAAALEETGISAAVDDHARWAEALDRAARTARLLALALLAVIAVAAAAAIAFAARASLAARLGVAETLHLSGADDSYIAALFQRRFFFLGVKAGIAGAFFAAAAALLVAVGGAAPAGAEDYLPDWASHPVDLVLLLAAPLLAGIISALSARLAVSADLRRRW
ncbi:MAG: hypothetical protein KIS81_07340 [Maricaulaceae bacterium]|nr:hypothetical protein [Maricaulaceae bacterium]